MALSKIIGRNIKHIRETKGIKQVHLAAELKISPQTLSYIENGKREFSISTLEQIAKVLEVNVIDFLSHSHYEDPLTERKQVLENAAVGLVNMYNDLDKQRDSLYQIMQQMQNLIKAQEQIIILLYKILDKISPDFKTGLDNANTHSS